MEFGLFLSIAALPLLFTNYHNCIKSGIKFINDKRAIKVLDSSKNNVINTFLVIVPILYPSEWISVFFQGYKMGVLTRNRLNSCCNQNLHESSHLY